MINLRPIPGQPDYLCGDDGSIWSTKGHGLRRLKTFVRDRSGHLAVNLTHNSVYRLHYVHRLVAVTWLEPPPHLKALVRHRDDDVANNRPSNLRWGTNAQNSRDMTASGRQSRGDARPLAKLTVQQVREIRCLASTIQQNRLAKRFGVGKSVINSIVNRKTWKHV